MTEPRIARRMADIQPFHVMDLLARARALEAAGKDIVHMEIGEPDFITPQPIIAAGQRALAEGRTHYTPACGLPELRSAISGHYRQEQGLDIAPQRIVITPGASGALQLVLSVLINPGDQVLMADPGYPCNRHFVRLVEGEAVGIAVTAATDFQLTAELVERAWTARSVAVLLASPSNPTGTLIDAEELAAIHRVVQQRGGVLIVDEIYHGLVYDAETRSALHNGADIFVINSFSKYYGMTGWRLGWLVAPDAWLRSIDKLAQNIFLAASTPAQYAALAAFTPETQAILEQRRAEFQARRDYLLPALRELGFIIAGSPQGAFYLYADCSRFTDDSYRFVYEVLENAGVAITPGIDFGNNIPERYVRFAYTTSLERLREGIKRLTKHLRKL